MAVGPSDLENPNFGNPSFVLSNCQHVAGASVCDGCRKTSLYKDGGAGACNRSGPGGDCEHYLGLPGKSIPRQHDGPDDTVDVYGKPNGWCWSCWKSYQITKLRAEVGALEAWQHVAAQSNKDISTFLRENFPHLELDSGMPVENVRKAVRHLHKFYQSGGFTLPVTTNSDLQTVLSLLQGELTYDNRAKAKKILGELLDLGERVDEGG